MPGVPVTIHVADPVAFFEPLDARNERWEELHAHPDWHFWPTRPPGRPDLDGFPPFDELIDGLESVVVRHPGTVFIGAHVGCAAEDLARVALILERAPNFHVDLAARIAELGRQPYTSRAFIERWADRVLFGTDMAPDPAWWAVYYRFLETADESFAYDAEDDSHRARVAGGSTVPAGRRAPTRLPRQRRASSGSEPGTGPSARPGPRGAPSARSPGGPAAGRRAVDRRCHPRGQ